jgi:peptide/nickel transport system substrate-binding protein
MMVRRVSLIGAAVLALLPASAPAQGGSATFLAAGDVDYLDPGQTYYTFGYMVTYAVNRPLYSFAPGETVPRPDLAAGPPEISPDNRTITVRLRSGVRYAPPVNREVVAADVEYAIERAFSSRVPSGYALSYFSEIVGAPTGPGRIRDIRGVSAPDPRTLVIQLSKPVAQRVAAALVMPITVPVPREHARKYDRRSPSDYDRHVAYTGPYMVARRNPGKAIRMVRNPNWDRATDFRPAYLDEIVIDEGNDNLVTASRRALEGSRTMCCDAGQPPIPVLRAALRDRPGQVQRVAGGGTRWIALNTRVKPFNDIDIRKGVIAGMNRNVLRLARGGQEVGPIAQHYIPPGIPGHEQTNVSDLDYLQFPEGNRTLALQYFRRAKVKRRTRRPLLMVATNADPGRKTAEFAARQFRRLGFRVRLKIVPQDTLYTKFCGVPRQRVPICPNVGWFKDFQDPESMLAPTFDGRHIQRIGNVNWSQLNVPSINGAMDAASVLPFGPDRANAWAAINREISARAPGVPYVWDDSISVASADLDVPINQYFTTPDLSFVRPR